jgi:hypothetical protein
LSFLLGCCRKLGDSNDLGRLTASAPEDLALLGGELLLAEDAVIAKLRELLQLSDRVRLGISSSVSCIIVPPCCARPRIGGPPRRGIIRLG